MTTTLYELVDLRDVLDEKLAETEGEVTPELEQALNELAGKTNDKIERVALYVREQLTTASAIDEEAKRLTALSQSRKRAAEGLKAYLKNQMDRLELTKVNGLLATVAIQKNSVPSVTCGLTSEQLKAEYAGDGPLAQFIVEIPASYRITHSAVVEAVKAGDAIPAEITVEQGTHLRIR